MRQANWDEVFQKRRDDGLADDRLASFVPWEEWLTLAITAIIFFACIASVQGARWVDGLPSLYPIGFAALLAGYGIARVRLPAALLLPLALAVGAAIVYLQLLAVLPGGSLVERTDELVLRMRIWWSAVTLGGISTDSLPVIVFMLSLTWVGAFLSSWAIFRLRNAWLGLVPSGLALMWNISFIPGQFSYSFVIYCFGAVLLVMRLHLAEKQKQWDEDGVAYPEFMSLSVLHATFWVALALLGLVWLMPLAHRSDSAQERWDDFTAPLTSRLAPYARVFVSVNAKKPIAVHNLKDALPFQGQIKLSDNEAVEISVELSPEMAPFLREQSFDEYSSSGWTINVNGVPLDSGEATGVSAPNDSAARQDVTVNITIKGADDHLLSVGQPVQSDAPAQQRIGNSAEDVSSLEPRQDLGDGDSYSVVGSAAVPSVEQLIAAPDDYPAWVEHRYLALPPDLPERVHLKTLEVTSAATSNYERAVQVQNYIRTFPVDFDVPETPPGRDTVDFFLFDVQHGYFDYHASAMAVMLRTIDIPARVATGYVVDPFARDGESGAYRLTQRHAYAWPEVYFPGIGWVEFSPSPDRPVIPRRVETPVTPEANDRGEHDASGAGQDDLNLGAIGDEPIGPRGGAGTNASGEEDAGLPLLLIAGVLAAFAALAAVGVRIAWQYGLGGLSQPAQVWEKTRRLARLGSAPPAAHETPREFAARLQRDVPGAGAAGYVAARYESDRFGHKPITEDEQERLEAAWASVRNALLRRVLRLKPRTP